MEQTTSSSKGRKLAKEVDSEIDRLMERFDRLVEDKKRETDDQDTQLLLISQNTDGISGIDEYFLEITIYLMLWSASRLSAIYGVQVPSDLSQTKVRNVQRLLKSRYSGMVDESRYIAKATAGVTGGITADLLVSPRNINSLRKTVEFAATFSAQHGIYLAGIGAFKKKRTVVVFDSKTTDLCRNRMANQEVGWKEFYVDPVSGSEWLHPPFIFAKLSKAELLHACRTASVPSE